MECRQNSNNVPFSAIKYQFLKATIKCSLTRRVQASVSIDRKMAALSFYSKICQNPCHWLIIFNFNKYQVLAFINVTITRKRQQGSNKFRIWKVLIVKWRPFQLLSKFEKCVAFIFVGVMFCKILFPVIFCKTLPLQN